MKVEPDVIAISRVVPEEEIETTIVAVVTDWPEAWRFREPRNLITQFILAV